LERNRDRITYTLDAEDLGATDVLFVCVQTPPTYSGDADLSYVWNALDQLPRVDRRQILAMKSTVPVGTGESVRAALEARGLVNVGYVSNPEFLAEGTAVRDFMNPDRLILGAFADDDAAVVEALYSGIEAPVVRTDVASAAMIKLAAIEVNELQKRRVITKLEKHLGKLRGKTIAVLGLAFKPNTDDLRDAPSLVIASRLLAEGAIVRTWDPVANARGRLRGAQQCDSILDAVTGADAAVIVTEWPELRDLASAEVREAMARPLIVDGRNVLDPAKTRAAGFAYEGIGRGS